MNLQLLTWPDGTRVLTVGSRHWLSLAGNMPWIECLPSLYLDVLREALVTQVRV